MFLRPLPVSYTLTLPKLSLTDLIAHNHTSHSTIRTGLCDRTSPPRRPSPSGGWSSAPRCVPSFCWSSGLPSYTRRCGPTSYCRRSASLRSSKKTPCHTSSLRSLPLTSAAFWCEYFALTSDGSQSGYDPGAGGRRRALAPLPLVHTGGRLDCDLMLKACRWRKKMNVVCSHTSAALLTILAINFGAIGATFTLKSINCILFFWPHCSWLICWAATYCTIYTLHLISRHLSTHNLLWKCKGRDSFTPKESEYYQPSLIKPPVFWKLNAGMYVEITGVMYVCIFFSK